MFCNHAAESSADSRSCQARLKVGSKVQSFINARIYDGFRKAVTEEFNEIYIIDLKGDAHTSGERRRREGGNIFSNRIKVGVAVYFLIRHEDAEGCRIFYNAVPDCARAEEKIAYLRENRFTELRFDPIHPDKRYNWINLAENEWEDSIPAATKETKFASPSTEVNSVFRDFYIGVVTARDEWATDLSRESLSRKMRFFIGEYDSHRPDTTAFDTVIKWSRNLRRNLARGLREPFDTDRIRRTLYRPYYRAYIYDSEVFLNDRAIAKVMTAGDNLAILFSGPNSPKSFTCLVTNVVPDFNSLSPAADGCRVLPLYDYTAAGERVDNITDWALAQFQAHYPSSQLPITKPDIFHYVYAVLHHPAYRQKYELNLKREFPRIPFYDDFWQWAEWGRRLMDLHLDYEQAEPYALAREDLDPRATRRAVVPRLIARKETGVIEVDTLTTLRSVPPAAWEYRLGTYSALEWVLERHKERTPKDPTIREKFNTYRFADYKERVIDLLRRVCTVSVETMKIVRQMPGGDIERQ